MAYKINESACMGCHGCMGVCPVMAIVDGDMGKCKIDTAKCMSCGTCVGMCPVGAIAVDIPTPPATK